MEKNKQFIIEKSKILLLRSAGKQVQGRFFTSLASFPVGDVLSAPITTPRSLAHVARPCQHTRGQQCAVIELCIVPALS